MHSSSSDGLGCQQDLVGDIGNSQWHSWRALVPVSTSRDNRGGAGPHFVKVVRLQVVPMRVGVVEQL